jgi:hypothetical protein
MTWQTRAGWSAIEMVCVQLWQYGRSAGYGDWGSYITHWRGTTGT